jgi:hypothetical protein
MVASRERERERELYTERQIDEKERGEKGGIYTLLFSTFKVNKNWKLLLFSLLLLTRGGEWDPSYVRCDLTRKMREIFDRHVDVREKGEDSLKLTPIIAYHVYLFKP